MGVPKLAKEHSWQNARHASVDPGYIIPGVDMNFRKLSRIRMVG